MLDPHTSVAKTVLDTLERDDAPIVISATAHYSKFADSVLTATGHPTKSNKPTDLINQAIGLTRRPAKHQHLIDDVSRGRYHKVVSNCGVCYSCATEVSSSVPDHTKCSALL